MERKEKLRIEIIVVGTELLSPFFRDTNSSYLIQRLNDLGLEVSFKTTVGDDWDDLTLCLKEALSRAHLIFCIGGLGPTLDDRTREALAYVLGRKLIFRKELLQAIQKRFRLRGLTMPLINKKQAYIIEGAEILENKQGTAPGLWLEIESQRVILLPGPPHELKSICESSVFPRLQKSGKNFIARKTLKITGLTESEVESLISDLYPRSPDLNLTTLAQPGQIELHLLGHSKSSQKEAEAKIIRLGKSLIEKLKENVFSQEGEELEEVVGTLLRESKKKLAVAESCTGGLLSHRLTNIPGSSDYFLGGTVVYSNEAKSEILGVSPRLIKKHGAVSYEVSREMAMGIRVKANADYGLSISGIAGPQGGTHEKPVGLVYIGLAGENGVEVSKHIFLGNRSSIKFQSTQKALDILRRHLLSKGS